MEFSNDMANASPAIAMEDGSRGAAQRFEGEFLDLRCERAYPPGRPLNLTLDTAEGPLALSGRCIGSKQQPEGDYAIRLRMTNLRRESRIWLAENLGA